MSKQALKASTKVAKVASTPAQAAPTTPAPAAPTNVAIAPRHPAGTGKSTKGGHVVAWRGCKSFDPSATITVVDLVNRWRQGTPGSDFFEAVLAKKPATVQAALDLAKAAGIGASDAQGHLRWYFTWGSHIQVNGQFYKV